MLCLFVCCCCRWGVYEEKLWLDLGDLLMIDFWGCLCVYGVFVFLLFLVLVFWGEDCDVRGGRKGG